MWGVFVVVLFAFDFSCVGFGCVSPPSFFCFFFSFLFCEFCRDRIFSWMCWFLFAAFSLFFLNVFGWRFLGVFFRFRMGRLLSILLFSCVVSDVGGHFLGCYENQEKKTPGPYFFLRLSVFGKAVVGWP